MTSKALEHSAAHLHKGLKTLANAFALAGDAFRKAAWDLDNSPDLGILALYSGVEPTKNQRAALMLKYGPNFKAVVSQFMSQGPESTSESSEG